MDAGLSDRSFNILQRMRPDFLTKCVYHHNTYQNSREDNYAITISKQDWLTQLYSDVNNGLRVVIPISNLTEAKVIYTDLKRKYPTKMIKIYSSETNLRERKLHFSDVNTYWAQYDVLIYTPTVSAGVSFEKSHFDIVYGYFTDMSCPIETCIQMIGRIRDVKLKKYVMYLDGKGGSYPTDIETITKLIYTSRDNLNKTLAGDMLAFEYGPNGELKYYNTDYFYLYMENLRVRNYSKNNFIKRFVNTIAGCGSTVTALSINQIMGGITADHIAIRNELKHDIAEQTANAIELSYEQYIEVRTAVASGEEVTAPLITACVLFKLRRDYNYNGVIDAKFVSTYHRSGVLRWYKNLTRLYRMPNIVDSLELIRADEVAAWEFARGADDHTQNSDINRRYVYDQHRIAIGLLRCGWDNPRDPKYITCETLAAGIKQRESSIRCELDMIYHYFEAKRLSRIDIAKLNAAADNQAYIAVFLPLFNRVLYIMYGITMKNCGKLAEGMYMIETSHQFAYTADGTGRPVIPICNDNNNTIEPDIPYEIIE
jgi:hypothetical protein